MDIFEVKFKQILSTQLNSHIRPLSGFKSIRVFWRALRVGVSLLGSGLALAVLLLWFGLNASQSQAAPAVRPLATIFTGTLVVTHTREASATHEMTVFADGNLSDQFIADNINQTNQIGANITATTLAIMFDQHGGQVDVGSQSEFSATTPITLNDSSTVPGYSQDSYVMYGSKVLSYQVTQRTLVTAANNCVIMELNISNTGNNPLTGGKLLYMVDIQVGEAASGDEGGFDANRNMVYQTDYNGTTQNGYAMGISLLQGNLCGYGVNGVGGYPNPLSDANVKMEMDAPSNTIVDGGDDVSWLVANIPVLSTTESTLLTFGLCARTIVGSVATDTEKAALGEMYGSFEQIANLSLLKTADPAAGGSVTVGERITYTVAVSNTGSRYVDNLILTDTVPFPTELITYSISRGSITATGRQVSANVGRLNPAGDTVTMTLVVAVPVTTAAGAIVNQAFINSEPIVTPTNIITHYLVNPSVLTVTKSSGGNWLYRKKLAFTNTTSSNLIDFPVLVVLNSSRIDYGKTQDQGQDLRFVDPDGAVLPYEIEQWDELGNAYVWVNVPQIDANSTNDYIWLYYANDKAPDDQDPSGVWPSGYRGVWHLNEAATNGLSNTIYADSTAYNNHGQQYRTAREVNGQIAGGQRFDNSGEYIKISGLLGQPTDVTLSGWADLDSVANIGAELISLGDYVALRLDDLQGFSRTVDAFFYDGSQWRFTFPSPFVPIAGTGWHHLAYTRNNSEQILYLDGTPIATSTFTQAVVFTGTNTYLGNHGQLKTGFDFGDGVMDEVRVYAGVRSADWLLAQYQSMVDNLISYGPEEPAPGTVNTAIVGGPVTYTLFITNTGAGGVTNVMVTDTLPAGAYYQSGGTLAGNDVRWTTPVIAPDTSETVSFVVSTCQTSLVNAAYQAVSSDQGIASNVGPPLATLLTPPTIEAQFAASPLTITLNAPVVFTGTVASNGGPAAGWTWNFGDGAAAAGQIANHAYATSGTYTVTLTVTDTCSYTDTVTGTVQVHAPQLAFAKYTNAAPVQAGAPLTYTLVVANNGPGAATGVIISDTVPANTSFVTATLPHTGPVNGVITWPLNTLNEGMTGPVTLTVRVDSDAASGVIITNTAWLSNSQHVTGTDTVTSIVEVASDLAVGKTAQPSAVMVDGTITYTVAFTNHGPSDARNVTLTDTLPLSVTYQGMVSMSPALAGPTQTGRLLTWYTPTLSAGTSGTLIFTATVNPDAGANLTNRVIITGSTTDPISTNNASQINTPVAPAQLNISKTGPLTAVVGQTVNYSFTVSVIAGKPVTAVVVSDSIAGSTNYNSGDTNSNSWLEIGESWLYTATYTVQPDDPRYLQNTAIVSATDQAGTPVSASDSHTTTLTFDPELLVVKTGPADARSGDAVMYTFTVVNVNRLSISSLSAYGLSTAAISAASIGDGSAISITLVVDDIAGPAVYVSGDGNSNDLLDRGEGWVFTAGYTITDTDPSPLVNWVTVWGLDMENDVLTATANHATVINSSPPPPPIFLPIILKN